MPPTCAGSERDYPSPIDGVDTSKSERRGRNYLSPEEHHQLLSAAGGNPRDYCILMTFQAGVRVSELCALHLEDIDLANKTLEVCVGKGQQARTIELENKGIRSTKTWLQARPATNYDHPLLNRNEEPLKEWGVRDLLNKYCDQAGITKKVSPHSLRHTFASYKAQSGVSPFQLREWLGHARLDTTSIYAHMAKQNAKKVMEATSL